MKRTKWLAMLIGGNLGNGFALFSFKMAIELRKSMVKQRIAESEIAFSDHGHSCDNCDSS